MKMAHREGIRQYLKDLDLTGKTVVDWGCGTKPMKNYLEGGSRFLGIDILDHVGADVVADICEPMKLDRPYDIAFCIEVLEHVNSPYMALENIYENLKDGGVLYLSVPFMYDVHSDHDLWRFTDQGLKYLLNSAEFIVDEIKSSTKNKMGWVAKAHKK